MGLWLRVRKARWRERRRLAAAGAALAIGAKLWLQKTEYFWRSPIANARFQTVTDFEGVEQDAAVLAAAVDGLLDAGSVELLLVGRRQGAAAGLELGVEGGANLGKNGLDDGSRVLRGKTMGKRENQTERYKNECAKTGNHEKTAPWGGEAG